MSQVKVDKRKELKRNRKKIVKQNKIKKLAGWTAAVIILAAVVGWLGWSSYNKIEEAKKENVVSTTADTSAISDYINTIGVETAADETK